MVDAQQLKRLKGYSNDERTFIVKALDHIYTRVESAFCESQDNEVRIPNKEIFFSVYSWTFVTEGCVATAYNYNSRRKVPAEFRGKSWKVLADSSREGYYHLWLKHLAKELENQGYSAHLEEEFLVIEW